MNSTTSIFPKNQCQYLSFGDRLVQPVRQWLDRIAVGDPQVARWLCQLIPAGCLLREISSYWDTIFSTYRLCAS